MIAALPFSSRTFLQVPPKASYDGLCAIPMINPSRNAPAERREKTCESCGRAFLCNAGSCWCDSVPLDPAALSALRAKYRDCLCEACLKVAANSRSSI